jgi:NAD(P)-dependent dehydrogenase (short-subunit alcohol dehydrogenase family)
MAANARPKPSRRPLVPAASGDTGRDHPVRERRGSAFDRLARPLLASIDRATGRARTAATRGTESEEAAMQDRVVLITGGTGALGSAVARGALEVGAVVVVTYRDAGDVDILRAGIPAAARERLHGAHADLTDGASVSRLVADVAARHGRLDALVNAVGGFAGGDLLATDERGWDAMLTLNLRSVYLCCRAALPAMLEAGRGRIVNVGSRSVVPPAGGFIAYTVAKSGVIALTQALAQEVRGRGVTVNAVLPSTMDTEANRRAMPNADRRAWVAPESVARAILFLASDAAADVTGSLLAV